MGNWLKNLKVGDKFYVKTNSGYVVYTVERFTNTQIVTKSLREGLKGAKFNKNTGYKIGTDIWHPQCAKELTEKAKKEIWSHIMVYKLKNFDYTTLTYEQLTKIKNITEELNNGL